MEESKRTKPDTAAATEARHEEATSGDTLSDVRESQRDDSGAAQSGNSGSSDSASTPAPDGTPETSGDGTADGRDTGGPM